MQSLIAAFVLACTMLITPVAFAEDVPAQPEASAEAAAETPADERAAQFVGVTGPDAESVPGGILLISAYGVVWVLLFLFLIRMRRLQSQTAEELERLSAQMKASEAA